MIYACPVPPKPVPSPGNPSPDRPIPNKTRREIAAQIEGGLSRPLLPSSKKRSRIVPDGGGTPVGGSLPMGWQGCQLRTAARMVRPCSLPEPAETPGHAASFICTKAYRFACCIPRAAWSFRFLLQHGGASRAGCGMPGQGGGDCRTKGFALLHRVGLSKRLLHRVGLSRRSTYRTFVRLSDIFKLDTALFNS